MIGTSVMKELKPMSNGIDEKENGKTNLIKICILKLCQFGVKYY